MFRLILGTILVLLACPPAGHADPASDVSEGLSWLHSFEYERALAAFERAEKTDPGTVMAYWGQAMCYQQFLWGNENVEEARAILGRLRRSGAFARATPQERDWIATLDTLFGAGDRPARLNAFAASMAKLAATYPADPDVAAFHGLALMATRARGLAGAHHASEGEMPQLAGSREQAQAARIFTAILREHPKHPGALHYLIHAWDDPQHARAAVEEARLYATVVPESSHARHMPAHVFMQLGLWSEAIASDEAAAAAAEAKLAADGLPVTAADFHPLSWLVYEYAQAGRLADAHDALSRLQSPAEATKDPRLLSLAATLRSRLAIEAENWTAVRGPGFINYDELFAVGFSAAQRGDTGLAERARIRLGELSQQPRYADRRRVLEIMAMQVGAAIRARGDDVQGALALLAEATAAERALPASIGPPVLIKPAQEQYAELLLQRGRAPEAAAQFEGALERAKNRRISARGLERARGLTARRGADASRRGAIAGGGGLMLLLVVLLVARRRRGKGHS